MGQVFEEAVRHIDGPVIIVERRHRQPYDRQWRDIPMSRVPLEQRTGMLHVIVAPAGVSIKGPEEDKVYPHGANYRYQDGYDLHVEVLPRGKSTAEYERLVERPPYIGGWSRVRRLRTQTPMVGSLKSSIGGSSTYTDAHLTVVQPRQLDQYLRGVLPYIGVGPRDVTGVILYIKARLEQGRRELVSSQRDR